MSGDSSALAYWFRLTTEEAVVMFVWWVMFFYFLLPSELLGRKLLFMHECLLKCDSEAAEVRVWDNSRNTVFWLQLHRPNMGNGVALWCCSVVLQSILSVVCHKGTALYCAFCISGSVATWMSPQPPSLTSKWAKFLASENENMTKFQRWSAGTVVNSSGGKKRVQTGWEEHLSLM